MMKKLLKSLVTFVIFIIVWMVSGAVIGNLLIKRDSGGIPAEKKPSNFDILVAVPIEEGNGVSIVHTLYGRLDDFIRWNKSYSFLLPDKEGEVGHDKGLEISYKAETVSEGKQLIEVNYFDGDRHMRSRYEATKRSIIPLYSGGFQPHHAIGGLLYGFLIAIALYVFLKVVLFRRRKNTLGQ